MLTIFRAAFSYSTINHETEKQKLSNVNRNTPMFTILECEMNETEAQMHDLFTIMTIFFFFNWTSPSLRTEETQEEI